MVKCIAEWMTLSGGVHVKAMTRLCVDVNFCRLDVTNDTDEVWWTDCPSVHVLTRADGYCEKQSLARVRK